MLFANLINAIVWLIVLGLVWWLVSYIPLPAPIGAIIRVLFIVLAVVVVLASFGVLNIGVPRLYK
jgi:hypothetical protein